MTAALRKFDLRHHHLFDHVISKEDRREYGKPTIRCASYDCLGVPTRLFFRTDVEALARRVHGDLDAHLTARKERRRRSVEKRQAKIARAKEPDIS